MPVRGRNSLDLELLYLALDLFGVDALVYLVHCAYEKVCADLLKFYVVLTEELYFVVLKTRRDGEDERMVEIIFNRFVE